MSATAVICDTPLSLEIEHAEASLADSATWRSLVADPDAEHAAIAAAADALISGNDLSTGRTPALAQIAWYEVDEEADPEDKVSGLPRAIIRHGESSTLHRGNLAMEERGWLAMLIEFELPEAYTKPRTQAQLKQAFKYGLSIVGRIRREMMAAQFNGGRLTIDRLEMDPQETGIQCDEETGKPAQPRVFQAIFRIFHLGP